MKTKNGKLIILSICAAAIAVSVYNNGKFKKQIKTKASMLQYRNRLSEFFDVDEIQKAFEEMQEYIDFGISTDKAFQMITMGK